MSSPLQYLWSPTGSHSKAANFAFGESDPASGPLVPTRMSALTNFAAFSRAKMSGHNLWISFLEPSSKAEIGSNAAEDLGPLDPHGNPFKQNKVCGHVLAPGEQRCCEKSTVDECHKCCIERDFDGIEGQPSSDTCRRTCVRMCYKGKDLPGKSGKPMPRHGKVEKHVPQCPDDPDGKVSLYPTSDQDSKLKDFVRLEG